MVVHGVHVGMVAKAVKTLDMQVRHMLGGETACASLSTARKAWATQEVTLQTKVGRNLTERKTKWYTKARLSY